MTETAAPEVEAGQATQALATEGQAETSAPWYGAATDEIKGYIQNKGWGEDPLKAVEGYMNLEKFRGVPEDQLLKLPKNFEEEGALDPIYDRLGRPKSAEDYKINLGEASVDENRIKALTEVAHKVGLNQKQLEALAQADASYYESSVNEFSEATQLKQQQEFDQLKREWGSNFDERAELGRRFLRGNLPEGESKEDLVGKIEEAIGTAATLKLFANAGSKVSVEDKMHATEGDRPFGYTREQALADRKQLMDQIKGDKERLANYNKGVGPDIDKLKKLNEIAIS